MTALLDAIRLLLRLFHRSSQRASEREHSIQFGRSLDLDPCQRARNWEGQ